MKILDNIEVPDEVMIIFKKWCNYLEYPETEQSLMLFFKDCYINFCEEKRNTYDPKAEIKLIEENITIANWTLFNIPYFPSGSIIDNMNKKLNEDT